MRRAEPHADSCFAVITDADAPDNAGRANDLTTSTDCVDQGHLGAVLTEYECASAYYYLRQNPQEDATPRNWRWPYLNNNKKWPYGCWWQSKSNSRDVWFWETPPDGTQNMETWPRQICRTACPGGADSTADALAAGDAACPTGFERYEQDGFWWCYNNGVQNGNRDEAIAMCAEAGMQVIELRTQAKAMAFHRWADHEFWLGLTCRSEEAACNGDPSLWSWNSDNAPLDCASGYIGFKKPVGGYTGFYGGAPTEFCAHVWESHAEWAPQTCNANYRIACEVVPAADSCTPGTPIALNAAAADDAVSVTFVKLQFTSGWEEAKTHCESENKRLAILNTEEKWAAAAALVDDDWAVWIGGTCDQIDPPLGGPLYRVHVARWHGGACQRRVDRDRLRSVARQRAKGQPRLHALHQPRMAYLPSGSRPALDDE